jgi:hypothetical protein
VFCLRLEGLLLPPNVLGLLKLLSSTQRRGFRALLRNAPRSTPMPVPLPPRDPKGEQEQEPRKEQAERSLRKEQPLAPPAGLEGYRVVDCRGGAFFFV